MFQPVSSKVNFTLFEERILRFWREHHIFEKSVRARQGAPRFVFYEGPPTANGSPGIHHVLSRTFKDAISRYRAMRGYYAPRKAGWDTHGLPVELEIEKMLGFAGKAQIEEYGVARFNEHCRESVFEYIKQWEAVTERIGFWLDMEHPYITLDNGYIESCWWAIKQLWDKGLIYQGYKVTPHCPRCGTSLSSHEVALGYRDDTEDPSVYIKFKLVPASLKKETQLFSFLWPASLTKPAFFLAWTTTPWTLPGNTALAISADAEYIVMEGDDDYLILASALVDRIGLEGYKQAATVVGEGLVGLEYEPLFGPHDFGVERKRFKSGSSGGLLSLQPAERNLTYRVIDADFVSMEEGTGIVHVAPAYGEVDYEAGVDNDLDFVHTVDLEGKVIGSYPFAGKFVKDADPLILDDLESRGLLYRSEWITHTYPFCWRCEAPLLYYAKRTWYIRTTAVKERLISGNAEINWHPEYIKHGRFGDWLENNVDWAFSRERYWGTPLNIWSCSNCGSCECVGDLEELKAKSGVKGLSEPLDLHRPFVDEIIFTCSNCGGEMRRQAEVIDCWFDSGVMPIAQWHYPFENRDEFEQNFPADFICEAIDQTRGWFYSLHAIAILLFNRPCFKNVICLGHVLDAEGEKMSKAKGNVVDPWTVVNSYGADALRWYFFTSSPAANVRRFSTKMVAETMRRFLMTLWNTYSFFVIYANIDRFDPKLAVSPPPSELDRWILSELNQLIVAVTDALDNYEPTAAARKFEDFLDQLSNWYVRRSRRRFWKSENDDDKLAAYFTLYSCLVTLSKLLAPLTPFIAEELYQNLVRSVDPEARESVHLTDFPVADIGKIDEQLSADMRLAVKISSLGRAVRSKAGIKVRQPLARILIKVDSKRRGEALERLSDQILNEINVKEMELTDRELPDDAAGYTMAREGDYWVAIATGLSPELVAEGAVREIVRRLQNMRRSAGFDIADHIVTYYRAEASMGKVITQFADYIKQETLSHELIEGIPEAEVYAESYSINGSKVVLGVRKFE